jgi:hypothetical protein
VHHAGQLLEHGEQAGAQRLARLKEAEVKDEVLFLFLCLFCVRACVWLGWVGV